MSYPSYGSILHNWVMDLPLRYQGVLLASVRGCDSTPKENSAKPIIRALRYSFMNCADEREVGLPSAFMSRGWTEQEELSFLRDWDHYPIHFVQHLLHAIEVVGYCHPEIEYKRRYFSLYSRMVTKLHLNTETDEEMKDRLTEDRLARYGNAIGKE